MLRGRCNFAEEVRIFFTIKYSMCIACVACEKHWSQLFPHFVLIGFLADMGCVASRKVTVEPILVKPATFYEPSPVHEREKSAAVGQPPQLQHQTSRQVAHRGTVFEINSAVDEDAEEKNSRPIHSLRGALVSRSRVAVRHHTSVADPRPPGLNLLVPQISEPNETRSHPSMVLRSSTQITALGCSTPTNSMATRRVGVTMSPWTRTARQGLVSSRWAPNAYSNIFPSGETCDNPDFVIGLKFRVNDIREVSLPPSSLTVVEV